jgi:hypothetical protein
MRIGYAAAAVKAPPILAADCVYVGVTVKAPPAPTAAMISRRLLACQEAARRRGGSRPAVCGGGSVRIRCWHWGPTGTMTGCILCLRQKQKNAIPLYCKGYVCIHSSCTGCDATGDDGGGPDAAGIRVCGIHLYDVFISHIYVLRGATGDHGGGPDAAGVGAQGAGAGEPPPANNTRFILDYYQ